MTTPFEEGDDLDFIVLGIDPSPGLCVVSGHDRYENWDIQKAKGQAGASSELQGADIGTFTVTFKLFSPEDFEQWDAFEPKIREMTAGPRPIAKPIYHPDLARQRFTEVSSGGIGARVHAGDGSVSIPVKFVEYKPPKPKPSAKAKATPGGAAGGTPAPKPDPNAAAKAQLAALVAEARKP